MYMQCSYQTERLNLSSVFLMNYVLNYRSNCLLKFTLMKPIYRTFIVFKWNTNKNTYNTVNNNCIKCT